MLCRLMDIACIVKVPYARMTVFVAFLNVDY